MTLQEAAEKTARARVQDTGWLAIKETFRGQVVWEGTVTLFEISCDPKRIIYGWTVSGRNGGGPEHVTVKKGGAIDSPLAAVRAWIDSQATDED
jgi:hypothetical protein